MKADILWASVVTALVLLLCVASTSCGAPAADESQEPPLEFVVKVGDKTATVLEGQTIQLEGAFTDPKVSVAPQPHRVFAYQGIGFKYPRGYVFEADLDDPEAKSWTLTGNDLTIMAFAMGVELTSSELADTMIEQFGRENCKVTNTNAEITLGKQKLSGTTLEATALGQRLIINIYRIPARKGVSKFILFQDSVGEASTRSKDGAQTIQMIQASFTVEQ